MRLQPAALFARRHIWLVCFVGLSGWSGLSDWFGLSVGLFVGWSIGLVGLVSVVWGLFVSSVL